MEWLILLDDCKKLLDEILLISTSIGDFAKLNKFGEVENLYLIRGDEINKLFAFEKDLNIELERSNNNTQKNEIDEYIKFRELKFNKIFSLDDEIKATLLTQRKNVMVELKQLHKGKKMQLGYLNNQKLNPGFIDLKE